MTTATEKNIPQPIRCAIYTRKSTEEGLDQEFNSLDSQREAAEAFIASQRQEGWRLVPDRYDDGGYSGSNMERPGLTLLLRDIEAGRIDCVVVYKVDRLSRSLLDFSKIVERFDRHQVTFVSITQSFNTTSSMGRLTLNILLSFAQFEREIISERIRDKVGASKRKGKYTGGPPVLGYDVDRVNKKLVINEEEAELVRFIFNRFLKVGSTTLLAAELNKLGHITKEFKTVKGTMHPGRSWNKTHLYRIFHNPIYVGEVSYKGQTYPGEHQAIITRDLWDKVHSILKENYRVRAAHTRAKTPALLKGIIRCGHCGCSMSPTFTRRHGKQYRYYLCLHASKNGYSTCPLATVAAGTIEEQVMNQLRAVFRTPEIIAQTFRAAKAQPEIGLEYSERQVCEAFERLDPLWDTLFPAEQTRVVQLLVEQVIVSMNELHIRIRREGLHSIAAELNEAAQIAEQRKDENECRTNVAG